MLAAIDQAVAVAEPIEQGRAEDQNDQRADLNRGHVVCSWYIAGGGSAGLFVLVLGIALRSAEFFVGLVRSDINQRGNVTDVSELRCFTAAVQHSYWQLNTAV